MDEQQQQLRELLNRIQINPNNPRVIKPEEKEGLKTKMRKIPQMLEVHKVAYDSSNNDLILGGNQRTTVLRELVNEGFELKPEYFIDCASWTEEQKQEFIIIDNISDGGWNWELLKRDWDKQQLQEWGVDMAGWDAKPSKPLTFEIVVKCESLEQLEETQRKMSEIGIVGKKRGK